MWGVSNNVGSGEIDSCCTCECGEGGGRVSLVV